MNVKSGGVSRIARSSGASAAVQRRDLGRPLAAARLEWLAVVVLAGLGPLRVLLRLLLQVHDLLRARRVGLREDVLPRVAVRDELDAGPELAVDLVAAMVVVVPVRRYDVAHRAVRQLAQLGRHHARRRRNDPRVHDEHVVIVDDEERVAFDQVLESGPSRRTHRRRRRASRLRRPSAAGPRPTSARGERTTRAAAARATRMVFMRRTLRVRGPDGPAVRDELPEGTDEGPVQTLRARRTAPPSA